MGSILGIAFIWLLNFAISWWNGYAVGKCWAEAKAVGGWMRFMTWVGAIMSAAGFTWCYVIVEAAVGAGTGMISPAVVGFMLSLSFVILIPIILFASYAITFDSWAQAIRNGGILNYGIAGYNTYATIHNTASAIEGFGEALSVVGKGLGKLASSDEKGGGLAIAAGIVLTIVAFGLGTLTTYLIIKKSAASAPLLSRDEMEANNRAKVSLKK